MKQRIEKENGQVERPTFEISVGADGYRRLFLALILAALAVSTFRGVGVCTAGPLLRSVPRSG